MDTTGSAYTPLIFLFSFMLLLYFMSVRPQQKRAKELHNQGYQKTEILRMIIKEFKLDRNINSRSWPKWLSEI